MLEFQHKAPGFSFLLSVFFLLQIISGFWICNLVATSILTYFGESYHGGGCTFQAYFKHMAHLSIMVGFTIVSITTFICYICIFTKILNQRAKRSQLGKLRSVNITYQD